MFDFLFPSDGTMEIVAHKVVDKGDITQMGEAVSKGDKEGSTQAAMEVKEGREDIIQDKVEAMVVKEVTTQEAAATKVDKVDKEVTTLVTMAVVVKEDKEGTIQVGMATKEEARAVTIQEEMVTTVETGGVAIILEDLWMRRGTLETRSIGRLSAQLSEVQYCLYGSLNLLES